MSIKLEGQKFSEFVKGRTAATAPADDDYIVMDGATNSTRRMLASKLATAEALSAEAAARLKDEESLGQSISSVGNSLSEKVAAEETARSEADATLAAEIATKLDDAPSDGQQYVRKDGAWKVNETVVTESEYAAMEAAGTVDPEMKYVIVEDDE